MQKNIGFFFLFHVCLVEHNVLLGDAHVITYNECLSMPGFYWKEECLPCPSDHWCTHNIKTACPEFSIAPSKSTHVSNCVCEDGYFNTPTIISECQLCPADNWCVAGEIFPCMGDYVSPLGSTSEDMCRCPDDMFKGPYPFQCECHQGFYYNFHQKKCVVCEGENTSPECKKKKHDCVTGSYCINGNVFSCPLDTYTEPGGGFSQDDCIPCPANHICKDGILYFPNI